MTFETAFKRLKGKFANVDASALDDMAIQITISDEDCGGTFYAEVKGHVLNVEPYDYKDNNAIIDATRAALSAVLDGKSTVDAVIEKGDMTVMGDLQKVAAIRDAIKIPEKKPAAKKPAAKKTEKKPAAKPGRKKAVKPEVKETTKAAEIKKPAAKAETTVQAVSETKTVKKEEAPVKKEEPKKVNKVTTKKTAK